MRVVSWNMGMGPRGGGSWRTHDQAWHYLLGLGPDLAFVQESLPPAWVRADGTLVHEPFEQWGSTIFSARYPIERYGLPAESNLRAFGSYLALAKASLRDGTDAFVASVHTRANAATAAQLRNLDVADAKRPSAPAANANDAVFAGLLEIVSGRFIVAGDWNTARTQGTDRADRIGAEFFDRAEDHGWFDCVRARHKDGLQTWWGGGKILQDDHVFCDADFGKKLGGVWVAEDAVNRLHLSDHAPLVLDFDVESIAMTSLGDEPAKSRSEQ